MNTKIRAVLTALLVLALAVTVAACGGGDDEADGPGTSTSTGNTPIKNDPANKGKSITVGSKNFPEQFILGHIYAEALERAGYDVKREMNLGSEVEAFKALKAGEIDGYPEYTGTALTNLYKVDVLKAPKDPQETYQQVKEKAAADKITVLPPTPFENTYRLGITKETAEKLGNPTKISDLKDKASELVINGFPECRQRPDCLIGVEKEYGFKFKEFLASEEKYQVLDEGEADVAFVFSTDGPLATGKYVVLEDDKQFFPPYNVSFMVKSDTLQKLGPNATDVIERIQKPLTEEVMQELNQRYDLDKEEPEEIAKQYLQEEGFIPKS
jgi:glycine betaine/choline ABC-type transport system substrate-binding protein